MRFLLAGLCLAMFLLPFMARATPVDQVNRVLAQVARQTRVEVLYPASLPDFGGAPVFARILQSSSKEYEVILARTPDCDGAASCQLASFEGAADPIRPPSGHFSQKFTLENGVVADYAEAMCRAKCSHNRLIWGQDGFYYRLSSAHDDAGELVGVAGRMHR